ncbi:Abi family protein [Corynebacterium sp.]|uniref:Abi family protein n=1 Tax=Corynebacterium sp. TaxID=1720 RepID=UPI0026E09C4E|nr:Abi family protein [Corynebacterium sp.]MDO5512345.1 Abi family protein [Corynebacterium sp.]
MRTKSEVDAMLGAARFETYYVAAGKDIEKAVQLYRWNTRLAGAFHSQLSYFEVLTRNAMNSALQDWNDSQCGHRDWSLEHQSAQLLYDMFNRPMVQARKWARKESKRRRDGHARQNAPLNHDDVVAQLTLGNWSNLLGEALPAHRPNAERLWKECLHRAFPNIDPGDQSREDIGKKFERLTHLRNRVSHQENLLKTNVRSRLNDMLAVLKAIDESYPHWAMVGSQVRQVAREDPRRSWA